MSWWDTSQLTSFATSALKTAQKKIDKVLDIQETGTTSVSRSSSRGSLSSSRRTPSETSDFFSDFLDTGETATKKSPSASRNKTRATSVETSGVKSSQLVKGKTKTKSVSDETEAAWSSLESAATTSEDRSESPQQKLDSAVGSTESSGEKSRVAKFNIGESATPEEREVSPIPTSSVQERLTSGASEKADATKEGSVENACVPDTADVDKTPVQEDSMKIDGPKVTEKTKVKKKSAPLKLGSRIGKKRTPSTDSEKAEEKIEDKVVLDETPTELSVTEPDLPTTSEPDQPVTSELDMPATTEPDLPATSETAHLVTVEPILASTAETTLLSSAEPNPLSTTEPIIHSTAVSVNVDSPCDHTAPADEPLLSSQDEADATDAVSEREDDVSSASVNEREGDVSSASVSEREGDVSSASVNEREDDVSSEQRLDGTASPEDRKEDVLSEEKQQGEADVTAGERVDDVTSEESPSTDQSQVLESAIESEDRTEGNVPSDLRDSKVTSEDDNRNITESEAPSGDGAEKPHGELDMIPDENADESGWMLESEVDLDTSLSNAKSESGEQSCDDSTHTLVPNESSSSVEEMLNRSSGEAELVTVDGEAKEESLAKDESESEMTGKEPESVEDTTELQSQEENTVKEEDVNTGKPCDGEDGNLGNSESAVDMAVSTMSTASSTSSFVKCMIEEAMTETMKHDDADSHSSVSTDHSDMVRIRSGLNSGHTSGDEIDTNTSSDIEIISTPTPNGDYRGDRSIDLSPLRHALSRTMRKGSPPGHVRSDSGSSGQSRPDDCEMTGAERHLDEESRKLEMPSESARKLRSLTEEASQTEPGEEGTENPLHTEKLLKKGLNSQAVAKDVSAESYDACTDTGQNSFTMIPETPEPQEQCGPNSDTSIAESNGDVVDKAIVDVTMSPNVDSAPQENGVVVEDVTPRDETYKEDGPYASVTLTVTDKDANSASVQDESDCKDITSVSINGYTTTEEVVLDGGCPCDGKLTPIQEQDTVSGSGEHQQLQRVEKIPEYTESMSNLEKKLAEMAEIIDVREKKLVELSVANADLTETNSILRCQLEQAEKAREVEMLDVNQLTDEFTVRLSEQELKLQNANKERDAMKKHLQAIEVDFSKKLDEMEGFLAEKEEQIAELLSEGEKLSKQQLQSNNIIKKLRAKEKETDSLHKSQKQTIEEQKTEILRLHNVLDSKEDVEKKQSEAITQLNAAVKKQDKEITRLSGDLEDTQEKNRSLQAALDNSYKELAELHKSHVSRQSKATEEALSAELQAKEELRLAMEKQAQQFKQEQEGLIVQIEDLQISLSRMEKEHGRREDVYRQEISDLHQRLQEAEDRNEELSQSVSSATRPLLRQIENLQSTYAAQSATYEKVEKTMTDRLSEAQEKLSVTVEKERSLGERCLELSSKNSSLESQVNTLRQDRTRLIGELDMERTKLTMMEDTKANDMAQAERLKNSLQKQIEELKKDKMVLENNVEMEKMKTEAEKKKLIIAHETIKEKERQIRDLPAAAPSSGGSLSSSLHGSLTHEPTTPAPQEESIEKAMMATTMINSMKNSVYESLRNSGAASMVENLQAQLKQRDGEITQLSEEISELQKTREALSRELVDLTTKNEKLQQEVEEYPEFIEKHKELDNRYQALLQMYGEKVEQMEELQLDLQDIRELYKTQIDQLLKNA